MLIITRDGKTYSPRLLGEPTYSYSDGYGYLQASVPCVVPDADIRGAQVRLDLAVPWWGVVLEQPKQGEVLSAVGHGIVGTYQRHEKLYLDPDLTAWQETSYEGRNPRLMASVENTRLRLAMEDGVTVGTIQNGFWRSVPSSSSSRVTFSWSRPNNTFNLRLYSGVQGTAAASDGQPATWTQQWEQVEDAGNLTGSASVDITDAHDALYLYARATGAYAPSGAKSVFFSAVKVYGAGLTTVNAGTVAAHIVGSEFDPAYVPSTAWLAADTTSVEPCVFGPSNPNPKLDELQTYSQHRFGWYSERVGGIWLPCPHWEPRPTEPTYLLDLDDASSADMDAASFGDLISAADVVWQNSKGVQQVTRRYDTDATHRLVALGMNTATTAVVREIPAQVSATSAAQAVGDIALSELGADQVKGSGTWSEVRTIAGARVPASAVRPNSMVRLYGLDKPYDVMITETEGLGDASVRITLDNSSDRLDVALSRLDTGMRPWRPK